uniref:Secreted protein n=1 Tax=Odontella aurita TaxID=265563 RepID=A0A7S4N3L7_9STRA
MLCCCALLTSCCVGFLHTVGQPSRDGPADPNGLIKRRNASLQRPRSLSLPGHCLFSFNFSKSMPHDVLTSKTVSSLSFVLIQCSANGSFNLPQQWQLDDSTTANR